MFWGKLKIWQERASSYIAILNFLMIFWVFVAGMPLGIAWYYWFAVIVIALVGILLVDIKIIYPQALAYGSVKNPEWIKLQESLDRIELKLEEKEGVV